MKKTGIMTTASLVYQAGIANVFDTSNYMQGVKKYPAYPALRLLQGDFRSCEMFARGLRAAGVIVTSFVCNMAGDITHQQWSTNLNDAPFSDKFSPVNS